MLYDLQAFQSCARALAAEGTVLLKNDGALPLAAGTTVALFGRSQFNYYKSGTGSGGMVNVSHVVDIPEALTAAGITLDEQVRSVYTAWLKDHPFDAGAGWAQEPWFQEEMPLSRELAAAAASRCDTAIVVIGRTAGEDRDNSAQPGSYLLTGAEETMLETVCGLFRKTVVLLNVGNIMDMKWVSRYNPTAVLYVWQAGEVGGLGAADVLTGAVNPCGKLSDTIARDIEDYPSTRNYGDDNENVYWEDIYVGYRYFETFAPEKVVYPFGFGLSYTTFAIVPVSFTEGAELTAVVRVTNTGSRAGKEVVQVYAARPQGMLGQPARVLVGYAKTELLEPGQEQELSISFSRYDLSGFDDSGITGFANSYVLEAGTYSFYVGSSVRDCSLAGQLILESVQVVRTLEEAMAPTQAASRLVPIASGNGFAAGEEPMPQRSVHPMDRRAQRMPADLPLTGDRGITLLDVADGRASMEDFISQLSVEELMILTRGEGMNSPKVTPGTGGAFGGLTRSLLDKGIPTACCSDGPSGLRMDCGAKAFAMPNGTLMACSFNPALVKELFGWLGMEMRKDKVDVLLGPGMNIHRNPLNGRNFEYFSEDPLLTGTMAVAQLQGVEPWGVTLTLKHFAGNNQEHRRHYVSDLVSARALREIYLKGYEIAVCRGNARCIMSTYGRINGIYTASHYDLLTTVLRGEWGFTGLVMTDWWAMGNEEGERGSTHYTTPMIRAQNDMFMVVADAAANSGEDDLPAGYADGRITLGELQRAAANVCRVITTLAVLDRSRWAATEPEVPETEAAREDESLMHPTVVTVQGTGTLPVEQLNTGRGDVNIYQIFTEPTGVYRLDVACHAVGGNPLAQIPVSLFRDTSLLGMISLTGADEESRTFSFRLYPAFGARMYLKLVFGQGGAVIDNISMELLEEIDLTHIMDKD